MTKLPLDLPRPIVVLILCLFVGVGCEETAKETKKSAGSSTPPVGEIGAKSSPPSTCLSLQDDDQDEDGKEDVDDNDSGRIDNDQSQDSESSTTTPSDCNTSPFGPGSTSGRESEDKDKDDEQSQDDDRSQSGGNGSNRGISFNTTLDDCNEKGKVWWPFGDPEDRNDNDARCGSYELVNWCCSITNVKSVFGKLPGDTDENLDKAIKDGFKLYNCAKNGRKFELHLLSAEGNKVNYKTMWFSGPTENSAAAEDDQCKQLTMDDLGLSDFISSDDPEDEENDNSEANNDSNSSDDETEEE